MKSNISSFLALSILLLVIIIAGCGGGGGGGGDKNPPTSANLRAAGEQIVVDTRTVWKSSDNLIQLRLTELLGTAGEQFYNNIDTINHATLFAFYPLDFSLYQTLFHLTPGNYNEDGLESLPPGDLQVGTWNVRNTVHNFTMKITRDSDDTTDTVTYSITTINFAPVDYRGELTYPTSLLTSGNADATASVTVNMSDAQLDPSTFTGNYNRVNGASFSYGNCKGDIVFRFKNGYYLAVDGNIIIPDSEDKEITIAGAIDTKDLRLSGSIKGLCSYDKEEGKLIPHKLTWEGLFQDKTETAISLDGALIVEAKNKNVNYALDNSADNLYNYYFEFKGKIGVGDAYTETAFSAEETSFGCYSLAIVHSLSNGGVNRQCSLNIANTDANHIGIQIDSTWGPATVLMDVTKSEDGDVSLVSGTVKVGETEVGTISFDETSHLIKVAYKDGSFETF